MSESERWHQRCKQASATGDPCISYQVQKTPRSWNPVNWKPFRWEPSKVSDRRRPEKPKSPSPDTKFNRQEQGFCSTQFVQHAPIREYDSVARSLHSLSRGRGCFYTAVVCVQSTSYPSLAACTDCHHPSSPQLQPSVIGTQLAVEHANPKDRPSSVRPPRLFGSYT